MARRKAHEREFDLEYINTRYLQGWSQQRIADVLNTERPYDITRQTVSNDLKELRQRWAQSTVIDLDEAKGKELARIDQLEREYWEQYEASKEDKTITSTKQRESLKQVARDGQTITERVPGGQEATLRTETRTGDPRYLAGVERCIKMRMDLLGLEAPKRAEYKGTVEQRIAHTITSDGMSDDELARIAGSIPTGRSNGATEAP